MDSYCSSRMVAKKDFNVVGGYEVAGVASVMVTSARFFFAPVRWLPPRASPPPSGARGGIITVMPEVVPTPYLPCPFHGIYYENW